MRSEVHHAAQKERNGLLWKVHPRRKLPRVRVLWGSTQKCHGHLSQTRYRAAWWSLRHPSQLGLEQVLDSVKVEVVLLIGLFDCIGDVNDFLDVVVIE